MSKEQPSLTFRGQRENEEVILMIHRHPWALVRPGFIIAAAVVIVVLAFVFFQVSSVSIWILFIVGSLALIYAIYSWFLWWNNLYLLTDERVIAILQVSLWNRRVEDYSLDKIQSVASATGGAAGTLLNFGSVQLAIMGIKDRVELPFVEDPYEVQEKILNTIKSGGATVAEVKDEEKPKQKKKIVIQH